MLIAVQIGFDGLVRRRNEASGRAVKRPACSDTSTIALPGITRKRRGRYWQYFHPDGRRVTDRDEIDRLNAVGMPPAYERCWFCPDANGHIQAVGYDARGRKQYRYHPDFRAEREARKYERLAEFGRALPKLRARVETDLEGKPTAADTVLARWCG